MNNLSTVRYHNYIKLLTILTKRQDVRMYLNLLLTLTAIAFFGWFAVRPTLQTIFELNQHIKEHQQTLALLEAKAKSLAQAQQALQNLQGDIMQIDEAIPPQPEPYNTTRQTEALAAKDHVKLTSIAVGKTTLVGKNDGLQAKVLKALPQGSYAFPLSFTVTGDPQSVITFLKDFSNLRQVFLWETSSMVGKPPGAATSLALSINGYVVFQNGTVKQ